MRALTRGPLFASALILGMRACTLACKLALVVVIGRYLHLPSLGMFGLASGAVALGPVLVGLGMVHVIMRDAVTLPLAQLTDHLRYYWCFTSLVYALLLVLAVLAVITLGVSWLFALVVAIMWLDHIGNDVFQLLSNLERPLLANINAFIRGALWTLIYVPAAILIPNMRSLPAVLGFWLAGSFFAFVQFAWIARLWPWQQDFSLWVGADWIKKTIRNAFVIYLSDLSFVAGQQLDRYIVTAFLGLEFTGIYFLYWSTANAVSMFVSIGVLQIQRPRLIKAHHEGGVAHRKLVARVLRTTALASLAFGIILGAAFYLALPLINQPSVADHLGALVLIMAGMAVRNVADAGAMGLFTARRDRIMTISNAAAVLSLVVSQVVLLPLAGLYGAGLAILAAFSAMVGWRHVLLFGRYGDGTD
jgi:O-antigen/teichoic acid export membrane protein